MAWTMSQMVFDINLFARTSQTSDMTCWEQPANVTDGRSWVASVDVYLNGSLIGEHWTSEPVKAGYVWTTAGKVSSSCPWWDSACFSSGDVLKFTNFRINSAKYPSYYLAYVAIGAENRQYATDYWDSYGDTNATERFGKNLPWRNKSTNKYTYNGSNVSSSTTWTVSLNSQLSLWNSYYSTPNADLDTLNGRYVCGSRICFYMGKGSYTYSDEHPLYYGMNGKSKKITPLYYGVNKKSYEIRKLYYGLNGKAKLIYEPPSSNIVIDNSIPAPWSGM